MTVYFIFYVIIIVFGLFVGDRRRGLYVGISFLLLFALIALRHPSMGFDLQYGSEKGYLGAYRYFASCSWREIFAREKFDKYVLL